MFQPALKCWWWTYSFCCQNYRKSHGTEQNHNLIVQIVPCNICFQWFDKLKRMIYNLFKFILWFRTKRLSKSQLEQNHKIFVLSESSYMSFFSLQSWLCLTYDYIQYIVADMGQIIYFCHVVLHRPTLSYFFCVSLVQHVQAIIHFNRSHKNLSLTDKKRHFNPDLFL